MGRRLPERRGRLRAAGPACSRKGCSTVLCSYNGTDRCSIHGGWVQPATDGERKAALRDVMAAL